MPRARAAAIQDDSIKDEIISGLEGIAADPPPRRGPGRPKGSTTTARKAPVRMARNPKTGQAMSKAQLKAQVATELYGFASLFVGMWGLRDPECAGLLTEQVSMPLGGTRERLEAIVEQTVEILARNDAVLAFVATTGVVGQVGMLANLLWPVAKQMYQVHGPGGHGHATEIEAPNYDRYPAPVLG